MIKEWQKTRIEFSNSGFSVTVSGSVHKRPSCLVQVESASFDLTIGETFPSDIVYCLFARVRIVRRVE